MTWEQLSFWTDEELGLQGPKKIEKTVAIQLQELREQIAQEIEAKCVWTTNQTLRICASYDADDKPYRSCSHIEDAAIARGMK